LSRRRSAGRTCSSRRLRPSPSSSSASCTSGYADLRAGACADVGNVSGRRTVFVQIAHYLPLHFAQPRELAVAVSLIIGEQPPVGFVMRLPERRLFGSRMPEVKRRLRVDLAHPASVSP